MSIETGLFVMTGVFIAVWLVFVIYSELSIARDKREGFETEAGGNMADESGRLTAGSSDGSGSARLTPRHDPESSSLLPRAADNA